MRKAALLLGAVVGLLASGGIASASDPVIIAPTGQEGCVSQAGDTCTYTSTRDGGYAGNGDWTLTVEIPANGDPRDTNLDGLLRYVITPANAPEQGCGMFGAGSKVTTNVISGGLAAGNPFPGASDPVVGANNDCATGKISAGNSNYTPVD